MLFDVLTEYSGKNFLKKTKLLLAGTSAALITRSVGQKSDIRRTHFGHIVSHQFRPAEQRKPAIDSMSDKINTKTK